MPKSVSKKQFRFMMAIANGKKNVSHSRGTPPKSVANKYTSPGKDAPEQHGKNHGGSWDKKKDSKKKLKKSFEQYYNGKGAGVVVVNDEGQILIGKTRSGKWTTPGGHVDAGEDFIDAAHRELREEANVVADDLQEIGHFKSGNNDSKIFFANSYSGKPKDSDELSDVMFVDLAVALDMDLRDCCKVGLKMYAQSNLKKSNNLKHLVALEALSKMNIENNDHGYDMSHMDMASLVGNSCFRMISSVVSDMTSEDFRNIKLDTCEVSIRKHNDGSFSGRITDGHKVVNQFTNITLHQMCANIMSVFEWYCEEDEHMFDILSEDALSDDAIAGGLDHLSDNYKKHNLANIYTEMENIRSEVRNGMAVDLQQVEHKIMSLFDKLEESMLNAVDKHNQLARDAGGEIEGLEDKLRELQSKVDELNSKPTTVEAYQTRPVSSQDVYDNHYMYLPKPEVSVGPNGKIMITFQKGWTDMEKSNFLKDMRAKIVNKRR